MVGAQGTKQQVDCGKNTQISLSDWPPHATPHSTAHHESQVLLYVQKRRGAPSPSLAGLSVPERDVSQVSSGGEAECNAENDKK